MKSIRQILAGLGVACAMVAGYLILPSSHADIPWPEGYVDRVYCDAGPDVCDGIDTVGPWADSAEEAFARLRGPVRERGANAIEGLYTDAVILPWPADTTKCDVHYLQHRAQAWAMDGVALADAGVPADLINLSASLTGNACFGASLAALPARLKTGGGAFRHGFAGHTWDPDAGAP